MMTPLSIKMILSEISFAKAISCVTITIVIFRSVSDLMTFNTSPVSSGSSAEVGSSKNKIFGSRLMLLRSILAVTVHQIIHMDKHLPLSQDLISLTAPLPSLLPVS